MLQAFCSNVCVEYLDSGMLVLMLYTGIRPSNVSKHVEHVEHLAVSIGQKSREECRA